MVLGASLVMAMGWYMVDCLCSLASGAPKATGKSWIHHLLAQTKTVAPPHSPEFYLSSSPCQGLHDCQ